MRSTNETAAKDRSNIPPKNRSHQKRSHQTGGPGVDAPETAKPATAALAGTRSEQE